MPSREELYEALESGKLLHYHVWTFMKNYMVCGDGCCDCDFDSVDETLDHLENLTTNFEGVTISD